MPFRKSRTAILLLLLIFLILGWQVVRGGPLVLLDEKVLTEVSRHSGAAMMALGRALSLPGHVLIVGLMTLAAVVGFGLKRQLREAATVLIAVVGSLVTAETSKTLVDRPRPNLGLDTAVTGSSFPSTTTVLAAAVFGIYAARVVPEIAPAGTRRVLVVVCLFVPLAVAASRVMVSEHYVTDVVAGLAIGAFWVLVSLAAFAQGEARFSRRESKSGRWYMAMRFVSGFVTRSLAGKLTLSLTLMPIMVDPLS